MAEKLTNEQEIAVYNHGGRLLVSAAAGSGKTKVLVDRLMTYIMDPVHPANIDDFLIITYTKAAAAELRVKIGSKLSDKIAENPTDRHLQAQLQRLYMAKISTVHSFCSEILRRYAYKLDIPADFRQAEDNECVQMQAMAVEKVLEEAYDHIMEDEEFRQFVNSQGFGRNDKALNNVILQIYHQSVNFKSPDEWLDKCAGYMNVENMKDVSETVWGMYLIEQLNLGLDQIINCMEKVLKIARDSLGGVTIAAETETCLTQLRRLRNCKSWDEIIANKRIQFANLKCWKKGVTSEERASVSFLQNFCKDVLASLTEPIVDSSAVILDELRRSAPAVRGMCRVVKRFAQVYNAEKRRRHLMDYTDLEQMCLTLFCGNNRDVITPIAREVGAGYREIMVDEYQDSNEVQDTIFNALTEDHKNCFMVGDVKQSIYQFRQADPHIFLKKYNRFAAADEAAPGEGRRVLLTYNFRSGIDVLEAANAVFMTCMRPELGGLTYDDSVKLQKLKPYPPLLDEIAVEFHAISTAFNMKDEQEAAFVAQRITELLDGTHHVHDKDGKLRPIVPEDITILLRSPGSQEETYARALAAKGIRYVSSRDVPLLQTRENMLMIALLQVINNPQLDVPLVSVLCSSVFGFTADELAQIRSENRHCSLYDSLSRSSNDKAKAFVETISMLRAKSRMSGICQIFEEIYARTRMTAVFSAMPDGAQRLENMEALYQHAAEFEGWGRKDLTRFVEHLENMDPNKLTASRSKQNTGCVSITSIHKSKGLEYPVVFLCGLKRSFSTESLKAKVFTHKKLGFGICSTDSQRRILYPTISKRAIKQQMIKERNSEEMRVLYVAMTRARDRLIMTYAASNIASVVKECVIAQNQDVQDFYAQHANSMGDWVMLSAVKRTEAGELFAMFDNCTKSSVQTYPWIIRAVDAPQVEEGFLLRDRKQISERTIDRIRALQAFSYEHNEATVMPSKQTATQRNRLAAENPVRFWRKPGERKTGGSVYGNIIHGIMEHLDYKSCQDAASVEQQLDTLVSNGQLSREERDSVDVSQLIGFFSSAIGQKVRSHPNVLREFQFSVLDQPEDPALAGEKVLLQGVVDCAMLDDDGIVILDFKTDRVKSEELPEKVTQYKPQLSTYAYALSRIYGKPVKAAYLYFFRAGETVRVF